MTNEQARMEETKLQLVSERDDALAQCDRLMTESTTASSEQELLAQQRKELLAERDQYRSDYSAAQMELERVCMYMCTNVTYHVLVCGACKTWQWSESCSTFSEIGDQSLLHIYHAI